MMMYSALLVAATAAFASAQVTHDDASGKFTCPVDKPNGAFCAGDSLDSNIIIRCTNGVGQPGNCNNNLAGYFPIGVGPSLCWQSSPTSGIAACAKNCVVQGSSGTLNGTLTLPNCTPLVDSSSPPDTHSNPSTTKSTYPPSGTGSPYPGNPPPSGNGTAPIVSTASNGSPTATPVRPSASSTSAPVVANGAGINSGSALAAIGLVVAYFL